MIDVDRHIDAAERRVGTRTLRSGDARVVTVSRLVDAPVDEVWDACTNPERIPRWFLPIDGELRVGGRYQLQDHAGGVVERCEPPGATADPGFVVTWEYGTDISRVEVRLTPEPVGTTVTLDHVGHDDGARWAEYGPGAVGVGWELVLLGLAGHLGAPGVPTPEEAATWSASPEARRFVTRSGAAWGAAHLAAGADPAAALAAVERTTAAYTPTAAGEAAGPADPHP